METAKTYVAWCPQDGTPLNEAIVADGWNLCPGCGKLYRVIIKEGKVTVIEDHKLSYEKSPMLRWLLGKSCSARKFLARYREDKYAMQE